ncbi:MAG TPA: MFS transporter [Candidatus Binataceae bacterium]|nr:MFS transporter [Candidatus Binataceae bacterium]
MANSSESHSTAYRWVIEALVFIMLIVQVMAWLAPAPILAPMVVSLHIGMGQFGLIISIIALCIAIFSFLGAVIAERLGTLRTLLLGLWLLALGEVASGLTSGYGTLLLCRVVEGVGYGLIIGPPAALVMEWFSEREWPYINMVNAMVAYVGITLVFAVTPPVYHALGSSWHRTLTAFGLSAVVVAIIWTVLGRERTVAAPAAAGRAHEPSNIPEVLRMRGVILMSIALFGGMWVFQIYTSFLPEFFRSYRGLSLAEASNLTGVLPLTGIFAAGIGGFANGVVGLRKPFLWPLAVVTLIGCMLTVLMPDIRGISLGLVLVGIGASGGLAATGTLMMELPGMTPAKMSSAFATIWAVGYAGAFISPFLGGMLVPSLGLRNVLLLSLILQLLPVVSMYMLPETGPGRRPIALAASPAAR